MLLAGDSVPGNQIAVMVGCEEPTVVTWRCRYAEPGLAGLENHPRPGSPSRRYPNRCGIGGWSRPLTEPPVQWR